MVAERDDRRLARSARRAFGIAAQSWSRRDEIRVSCGAPAGPMIATLPPRSGPLVCRAGSRVIGYRREDRPQRQARARLPAASPPGGLRPASPTDPAVPSPRQDSRYRSPRPPATPGHGHPEEGEGDAPHTDDQERDPDGDWV